MTTLKDKFTPSFLLKKVLNGYGETKRFGSDKASPSDILNIPSCFVLSTGRCGTALLTEILKNSDKLSVEHNPKPTLEYVSSLIHQQRPTTSELKLALLAARFENYFETTFRRSRMYIETNNRITFFAPAIAELLPNSRFIHLVRDPADFVRSGMRREYYRESVQQHQRLRGMSNEWRDFSRLEKIVWEWNEINSYIESFKDNCDPKRVMTIKSEELWTKTSVSEKIFSFLEIDNPFIGKSNNRIKRILNKKVNIQKSGSFPQYRHWSEEDKTSLKKIASLASRYDYVFD